MNRVDDRIAVCSWSLQPASVDDLIGKVSQCGLSRVQLALEPLLDTSGWIGSGSKLAQAGVALASGMMGCVGEDYSTIEMIKHTGGVMPDVTWPATIANMRKAAPLAKQLGLKLVTFHAGFIPEEENSPELAKGLARVREVADVFAAQGIDVALETGQEPAPALLHFLKVLNHKTVGVNFDPANMLLYGSGQPIPALKQLMPYIRQVHIKDAIPSSTPGEWGEEVPVSRGRVDWPAFFQTLKDANYKGDYVIEREAGTNRIDDVRAAKEVVLIHG